jgi:hypothetical protein
MKTLVMTLPAEICTLSRFSLILPRVSIYRPPYFHLCDSRFTDDKELKHNVRDAIRHFSRVLRDLIERFTRKYINFVDNEGDCVEKYCKLCEGCIHDTRNCIFVTVIIDSKEK